MQKKILSILLAAMLVCLLSFAVAANDFIEIGDADALMALMNAEDAATLGCNYKLVADIDLTDVDGQSPIGNRNVPFTGIFDGNGFTVKGIDIISSTNETGLFGGTKGATIQNLTAEGNVASSGNNVGGIVGRASLPVTIINCVNKISVQMTDTASKAGVGGVVATMIAEEADVTFEIKDCINYATISSSSTVSGYCGGVAGYLLVKKIPNANGVISNCINYGKVDSFFATVAGGIIGYARFQDAGSSGEFKLVDCANFGDIRGKCYNGGILGLFGNENGVNESTFIMDNVYNAGYVFGMSDDVSCSGSIAGWLRFPVPKADGEIPIYVTNAMDVANKHLSTVGNIGDLANSSIKFEGLYTTKGVSIVNYVPTASGDITVLKSTVTLSNCAVVNSDADALAALVASDTDAWSMVDGAPVLTYFTDAIAGAPAILGPQQPAETEAPETTVAAPETEAPAETTAVPAVTPAPAEGGAPIGLIIGIVAAVIVVAAVVVILLKKKKN